MRTVGLIAVVVGAAGSVTMMLRTGSRNPSSVLMLMFAVWVLSPFVALALADAVSARWSATTRTAIHVMMLLLAAATLAAYAGLLAMPAGSKPAFPYLIVPLASWLLLGMIVPFVVFTSRRRK